MNEIQQIREALRGASEFDMRQALDRFLDLAEDAATSTGLLVAEPAVREIGRFLAA